MLFEQEIMNNAFKDLVFREEILAKKYASLIKDITEPKIQQMIQTMEQSARNRYKILSENMNTLNIK